MITNIQSLQNYINNFEHCFTGDLNKAVEELVTVITERETEENGGISELDEKSTFTDKNKSSN